jgi:hypothetical protein
MFAFYCERKDTELLGAVNSSYTQRQSRSRAKYTNALTKKHLEDWSKVTKQETCFVVNIVSSDRRAHNAQGKHNSNGGKIWRSRLIR